MMLAKGKKKGLIDDDIDWQDGPLSERGGYRGKEFDALSLSENSEFPGNQKQSRNNLIDLLKDNETDDEEIDFHPNVLQDIPEEEDWRGGMARYTQEDQNHFIAAEDLSY